VAQRTRVDGSRWMERLGLYSWMYNLVETELLQLSFTRFYLPDQLSIHDLINVHLAQK
jgi:hypothetical protein